MGAQRPTNDDDTGRAASPASASPPAGRLSRFARLSGLSAGVAARHFGQKLAAAFRDDDERERAARDARSKSAAQITRTLGEMKGAAMKLGQLLATDPELLPPEMVEQIATLQHSAPPMPFDVVRSVVEQALGGRLEDHFASFSVEPIGAASIGQVHRATLRDVRIAQAAGIGARGDVAVKVQYPGIADTIASDVGNVGTLLNLLRGSVPRARVDEYLAEITTVLQRESDYLLEASNLERFCVLLRDVEGVRVPIPVHELTRKNVLVMEFLAGTRLDDWLTQASDDDKAAQGARLIDATLTLIHTHGTLHADPHPGNFLVLDDDDDGAAAAGRVPPLGILDCGCVRDLSPGLADDMIRMLVGMWRHDLDALQRVWRRIGFLDDGVDPEEVYEWLELLFAPLLVDRTWDFGAWKVQDDAMAYALAHPKLRAWSPPREVLFYARTLAGMRGLLHKTGVKVNAYRMSKRIAAGRGL